MRVETELVPRPGGNPVKRVEGSGLLGWEFGPSGVSTVEKTMCRSRLGRVTLNRV